MNRTMQIDGRIFADMIVSGTARLSQHVEEVNDLNVFPIPDGDTGANMMLTMNGGVRTFPSSDLCSENLSETALRISRGMLLGARGNSGVILSQFFAGIAAGLQGLSIADAADLGNAFMTGVEYAYNSVMTPTEGTILTVVKDATNAACDAQCDSCDSFLSCFLEEARKALSRTPDQLDVLKEAGVVDSGGAGLVYIAEGMKACLNGEAAADIRPDNASLPANAAVNLDLFDETMTLEYGYCTELLIRLQNCKTDPQHFDLEAMKQHLGTIGESIVVFQTGTIIKLHIHTLYPYQVLEYCQRFGEFLTVKIENMMLQHSEIVEKAAASPENAPAAASAPSPRKHKPIGIVTVAGGEGIRNAFLEFGADEVIRGGQTMNPSAEDFIQAFQRVNADTIFVLPNNGNILLAANQAAELYTNARIRVIPTKNPGDAWAILSMLDPSITDPDEMETAMQEAREGVLCAEISQSIRDAHIQQLQIEKGEYLGILGKEIVSHDVSCSDTLLRTAEALQPDDHALFILIRGKDADPQEAAAAAQAIREAHPFLEVAEVSGEQEIYQYILIAE